MKPFDLALRYMNIFYSGSDIEELSNILAKDLLFEGPSYTFDTADDYLDSLWKDPPEDMTYKIIESFENDSCACLIYKFSKEGISVPMVQLFEIDDDKISKFVLIFDTAAFT